MSMLGTYLINCAQVTEWNGVEGRGRESYQQMMVGAPLLSDREQVWVGGGGVPCFGKIQKCRRRTAESIAGASRGTVADQWEGSKVSCARAERRSGGGTSAPVSVSVSQ